MVRPRCENATPTMIVVPGTTSSDILVFFDKILSRTLGPADSAIGLGVVFHAAAFYQNI